MADANHNAKLFRQLTALVWGSRTFAHRNRPLYWHEVRRLRTLGRRYLSQVYGDGSQTAEAFGRLIEEAFLSIHVLSLRNRDGLVKKEGSDVVEYCGPNADAENRDRRERIYHLDKLNFNRAIQILIEAAHRVREDMRRQCKPSPAGVAVRLPSTITSPIAAKRMEEYMKSNAIGQEEFAGRASTTDRTLREFRNTGKVRRSIFESIAKAMGITKEDLMKPE